MKQEFPVRGFDFVGRPGYAPPVVEIPDCVRIPDAPAPFIVPDQYNVVDGREYTAHALREFDAETTARDNDPPREVVDAMIRAEFGPKVRRYQAKTAEELRESRRAYRAAHREEINAKDRARRSANKEKNKERHREYYAAHREECRARARAYAASHKDKISAYYRAYAESHRDEINAKRRARRHARKDAAK